jgi:FAD:protein FMN transferase
MIPLLHPGERRPHPPAECAHSARRMRIEMGTFVVIEAHAPAAALLVPAIQAAFAAVADIARHMHPQHPDSDVARINAAAPGTRVAIRADTLQLLEFAQHLHDLSDGIFDPCLPGSAGRLADLRVSAAAVPTACALRPLRLDLGGIAKGFAVDRALAALVAGGCTAGLVNAGGDLRVFGAAAQTILLKRADGSYQPLPLLQAALAVSDRDAGNAPAEHRGYYRRGTRARAARRYAAVRAADAMRADALTKCVLLCPPAHSAAILSQLRAENLT